MAWYHALNHIFDYKSEVQVSFNSRIFFEEFECQRFLITMVSLVGYRHNGNSGRLYEMQRMPGLLRRRAEVSLVPAHVLPGVFASPGDSEKPDPGLPHMRDSAPHSRHGAARFPQRHSRDQDAEGDRQDAGRNCLHGVYGGAGGIAMHALQ